MYNIFKVYPSIVFVGSLEGGEGGGLVPISSGHWAGSGVHPRQVATP